MSIQGYQNAYHNHGYTPSGSVSSSFSGSRGKTGSDGSHSHTFSGSSDKYFWTKGSVGLQGAMPSGVLVGNSPVYVEISGGTSIDGSHTHGYTPSGSVSSSFSGDTSTTTYDGNSSNHEARPSNYTYVIWKRVS